MNILQVNKFFWNKGGSETYYFMLSEWLQKQGHQVIPFSMQHHLNHPTPYSKFFVSQVDFQNSKPSLKKAVQFVYSAEAKTRIQALVDQAKPDIAHLHNISHQLTPAIIPALRAKGVPVVQTLHDYQLICPNYKLYTQGQVCERCFKHKYVNAALHACLKNSSTAGTLAAIEMTLHKLVLRSYDKVDIFICPSQFLFDRLVAWGIPQQKLRYIPHAVEPRPKIDLPKNGSYLFVGRLSQEKGIHSFIQAAQALPDIQFAIAGQAETEAETLHWKTTSTAFSNMTWYGQISDQAKLRQLMGQAKAVVVPSEWYENAPLVVLEAQAAGTWVLCSQRGGLPELIQSGKNGLVYAEVNTSGLIQAIRHMQDWPDRPSSGLHQKFALDKHGAQIISMYESLV